MTNESTQNLFWQTSEITRAHRALLSGHKSVLLWFTGLSGSGKSTLSQAIERNLYAMQCRTMILDGDNIRHGLCSDLGFSETARSENIRRVGEVAKLFVDAGVVTLAAFISPLQKDRDFVRSILGGDSFFEIYCKCSFDICESRDVKGLYKKAKAGEIKNFTGIDVAYEEPVNPDMVIDTSVLTVEESVAAIMSLLGSKGFLYG
ncbi:MAG: adenylyl-sulfate kinase [Pseudomonadota bacterium]